VSELTSAAARAYLVETIPVGLEDLRGTHSVQYCSRRSDWMTMRDGAALDIDDILGAG
jgi:hypothetical protein